MGCVETASFFVLVNGVPLRRFSPTRDIRQGDPLSPFLFLFCTDGHCGIIHRGMHGLKE